MQTERVPTGIESQLQQLFGLLACMTFGAMSHERIWDCAACPCSLMSSLPRWIAMAVACFLCYGFVFGFVFEFMSVFMSVSVYVPVYDPLAQRSMRLVLEEFAPALKLGE